MRRVVFLVLLPVAVVAQNNAPAISGMLEPLADPYASILGGIQSIVGLFAGLLGVLCVVAYAVLLLEGRSPKRTRLRPARH